MNFFYRSIALFCLIVGFIPSIVSQNVLILYSTPQNFFVCDTTNFSVTITNNESTPLSNTLTTLNLPSGVAYIPGSVTGGIQSNVTDLQNPVFSLSNVSVGATKMLEVKIRATCALVNAINAGATFTNDIKVAWTGGSKNVTTIPYTIETPLLVIASSTDNVIFGQAGDVKMRTFTIRNNRIGALDKFSFVDTHNLGGFTVSSPNGTVIGSTPTILNLEINGADFQQIGDGDAFFELNEEIVIKENITITDCGILVPVSPSLVNISWGCGDICQTISANPRVNILQAQNNPDLVIESIYHLPEDFCGNQKNRQFLKIKNIGNGLATNTLVELNLGQATGLITTLIKTNTIKIDSAGILTNADLLPTTPVSLTNCPTKTGYIAPLVTIPFLKGGDSITVIFDLIACDDKCPTKLVDWQSRVIYKKICPFDQIDTLFALGEEPYKGYYGNLLCIKKPLEDEGIYDFDYLFISQLLADSTGKVRVSFDLPCGMSWATTNFKLDNKLPVANGTIPNGTGVNRWFEFAMPFDSAFAKGTISFKWDCDAACLPDECLNFFAGAACPKPCDFDPDSLPSVPFGIKTEFLLHPSVLAGCGLKYCDGYDLYYACSDSCDVAVQGYLEPTIEVKRVNYGKPDNDNNRLADATGTIDLNKIRLDRFLPGDTVETKIKAAVHSISPDGTFENGVLRLFFESHSADNGIEEGTAIDYHFPGNIVPIKQKITIYDASSNQTYSCNISVPDSITGQITNIYSTININKLQCIDTFDLTKLMYFTHDISPVKLIAAGCALPIDYKYEEGDSITFSAQHRLMRNPTIKGIFNIRVKSFASIFNGYEPIQSNNSAPAIDFSCACPYKLIQLSSVFQDLTKIKINLESCENSNVPIQQKLNVVLGKNNFFPFEFRSIGKITSWINTTQSPVKLEINKIDTLRYQDNGAVVSLNTTVPFTVQGDVNTMNVSSFPLLDEGFTVIMDQTFSAPCFLNQLRSFTSGISLDLTSPLPMTNPLVISKASTQMMSDTFGFIPIRPFVFASGPNLNNTSNNNQGVWDFNFLQSGGASTATNCWIYFESATMGLSNIQLFEMPGMIPVPQVNGIYQLGNFAQNAVKMFRVTALNNSCLKETLAAFYGWNCTQVTSTTEQTCSRKTFSMSVTPQISELELDITTPSAVIDLCETTDYHTVKVFNTLNGAAFGVHLQVEMPAGLSIVPGTCQLAYPTGSTWVNIGNPTVVGGVLDWNVESLNTALAQNGLSGFQTAPNNALSIRFKTTTTCGFITGSQVLYTTFAGQNCGDSTNILSKPGDPILLDGVDLPDEVQIGLSADVPLPLNCNDDLPLVISVTSLAITGNSDSLIVFLPSGATFVANSYVPGNANAPANQPQVLTQNGKKVLKWKLKANVAANTPISLAFTIAGLGTAQCGSADTILAVTTQLQTATCVTSGSMCEAREVTGKALLSLTVYHPQFAFENFDVNFDAGIAAYSIQLRNIGTQQHSTPTSYKFYRDNDNSGTLTSGDVLKYEQTIFFNIGAGSMVELAGGLPVDLADICHLIVVLEAEDMCLCSTVSVAIDEITRHIPDKVVCSQQYIDLGVLPVAGHQYLWTPSYALTCDTCAYPQFNFMNETGHPMVFNYTFLETAGDCMVSSTVTATVLPTPEILTNDTTTCRDVPVLLTTTDAVEHVWYGAGITDPTSATQIVAPIATSIYFVRITDSLGCQALDTIQITIKPTAWAEIGPDTLGVCGNTDLQFNAVFDPLSSYSWSPASAVSNPNIHNPKFIGTSTVTIILTATIVGGCTDRDTVFVGFSDNPTIAINTPDITNCAGDTAFVTLTGAQQYFVAPMLGVYCTNGSCNTLGVFPDMNTTYKIVGYNVFGCKDSLTLTVNVPGTVKKTSESFTTCAGEPISIFGQQTTAAGSYSRTYQGFTGCDSIHTIVLNVLEKPKKEQSIVLCPNETKQIDGITYDKAGEFCQTFIAANGCDSTSCVIVSLSPTPSLDTFIRKTVVQGTESLELDLPTGFDTYTWSGAASNLLSCTNCPNPTLNNIAENKDSITFTVLVTNTGGCSQEVKYRVRFLPVCAATNVIMPNAFTPNGDDVNDVFGINHYEGFETFGTMEIYDRWGEKVYQTSKVSTEPWNGTNAKDKNVPMDVYIYILEVGCTSGKMEKISGDVTVIR
jgi:gliding motility-associated-like protein